MPEDEFRTDLRWPHDPLGERVDRRSREHEKLARDDAVAMPQLEALVADLRELLERLQPEATVAALDALREEVAALRRRIPLRASESGPLTADQLDQLAEALLERGVIPGDGRRTDQ